ECSGISSGSCVDASANNRSHHSCASHSRSESAAIARYCATRILSTLDLAKSTSFGLMRLIVTTRPSTIVCNSSVESLQKSIPQCLTRLQRVLNSLLRFLLAAKRFEGLALKIENVLLADGSSRRDISAAQDLRNFGPDFYFVIADVFTLAHQVNAQL